ncbi:MAG TPA: dihydropteroate synthase [Candidatus Bacteroides merdipullorum]|uniref:dihydropteroate synthase n=1 Tax=Candidatus Bacteroides merdipullorum TaxID=2838474 RepID=A0A9D2A3H0_9BACE|nr:dihydropteroate synthase [Candidatus Bacteroides merdipullorum]
MKRFLSMQDTLYINVNGRLMDLSVPRVMGILNVTPDSFFAASRTFSETEVARRAEQLLADGADIIDIGGYSTRPGAAEVSPGEEWARLSLGLKAVRAVSAEAVVSVDTFRADVARRCVEEYGVAIVNDISGGELDADMFPTVAALGVPYILMHMQGTPQTMQQAPHYDDVLREVILYLARKVQQLRELGVRDIILDPGFGFGKTVDDNYRLLACLDELALFGLPVLAGISRKSMICRVLDITPDQALNGTTVLNTLCLTKGARILRVHDVRPAVEAVRLFGAMQAQSSFTTNH